MTACMEISRCLQISSTPHFLAEECIETCTQNSRQADGYGGEVEKFYEMSGVYQTDQWSR